MLMGDYEVKRKIMLSGAARYDFPHLYIRKDGQKIKEVASYIITICNDGNAALGPIFLRDLFPQGASFINATLQPNHIDGNGSQWTILHLAIGDTLTIGINLDVERCPGDIINRAIVLGNYSSGSVTARNISVVDHNPLVSLPGRRQELPGTMVPLDHNISCTCSAEDAANQSGFLDPMQISSQLGREEEDDASCSLSTRALEEERY
jgi:uncharacterized repeat protein (TIGR01451 family)